MRNVWPNGLGYESEVEAATLLIRVSAYLYDGRRWREKGPIDRRAYSEKQPRGILSPY